MTLIAGSGSSVLVATCLLGLQVGQMGWKGVCAVGGMQSPVNIPISELLRRPSANTMVFDYASLKDATVVNSGHGAQVGQARSSKSALGAMHAAG